LLATCDCPRLDAGKQIIYQSTFTVSPGLPPDDVIRLEQEDNEPHYLVEGVRRVDGARSAVALPPRGGKSEDDGRDGSEVKALRSVCGD
jgi:hypothetical protein